LYFKIFRDHLWFNYFKTIGLFVYEITSFNDTRNFFDVHIVKSYSIVDYFDINGYIICQCKTIFNYI